MSLKPEPLVSVVTPVYNGEQHLRTCVESVLAQTYSNWEYTICNNCSTDRTLEIAQEYADKDPRIKVHNNQTFVNVDENHNVAFRTISEESKYCKVVAADEWILPECLETMVGFADKHPNVAIVGSYGLFESEVVYDVLPHDATVVTGQDLFRQSMEGFIWGGRSLFGGPTSVLYRSDIVRSRWSFYDADNVNTDTEVCFEFLEHFDFGFVHQVLTVEPKRARKGAASSMSGHLRTDLPNALHLLVHHGPKFLSASELTEMIDGLLKKYYGRLGREVYRRHDEDFWAYHKKKLAELGYPLSRTRVAAWAIRFVFECLANPRWAIATLKRSLQT